MKLINRIVENGNTVGFMLDEGDFSYPMPTEALYNESYLVSLIEAGYKFYDHNGTIELPNGESVDSLPSIDFSTVNQVGWASAVASAATDALTDAEASKYYAYKSSQTIELKTEATYEINTREEFEAYIRSVRAMVSSYGFCLDNRPINSFVNPAALFTVNEISEDTEGIIADKLNYLNYRHTFRNYAAYKETVKYLMSKGVLTTDTPTPGEFIKAYYAWGPDGITGTCVDLKFKQNVDGPFANINDTLPAPQDIEKHRVSNRESVPYIKDMNGNLRFLNTTVNINNITEIDEFGRKSLIISNPKAFINCKRAKHNGFKYTMGYCEKSIITDRLYFTFIADNGYKYLYKVSHRDAVFQLYKETGAIWKTSMNFIFKTTLGNISLDMDHVTSEANYVLWNIVINKAAKFIEDRTVPVPINSTYEMLMNVGMSPISAIKYMAKHVTEDRRFNSNGRLRESYEGLTALGITYYYEPIPKYILESFMLSEEDVEDGILSFLDIADPDKLIERREHIKEGTLTPGMEGYDYTYAVTTEQRQRNEHAGTIDALAFYNNVRFVYDCMNGLVNINAFGDGLIDDMSGTSLTAAQVLMSTVYAELGENPEIDKANELLENISAYNILNIASLFRQRDNAYKGYLIDLAEIRKIKSGKDKTYLWAYVTKIFRELGNKPVNELRPYLLELLTIDNSKNNMLYREALTITVKSAIEECGAFSKELLYPEESDPTSYRYGKSEESVVMDMADDLASQLIFAIIGKANPEKDGDLSVFNIKIDADKSLTVKVSDTIIAACKGIVNDRNNIKYITVFDLNEYEYAHNADGFAFNIVNASVTPWNVIPRKGYSIKTYSLLPSYYKTEALVDKFGPDWYNTARQNRAIVDIPLVSALGQNGAELPTIDESMRHALNQELKLCEAYEDYEIYTTDGNIEQVSTYVKRWAAACKKAQARGLIVKHMPMKQDVVYQDLSKLVDGASVNTELEFIAGENQALKGTETSMIKWNTVQNLLTVNDTRAYILEEVYPGQISTPLFASIYVDLIASGKVVAISGNWVITNDDRRYCVPIMTKEQAADLFSRNAVKSGEDYYISSISGIYKIGVN